MSMVLENLPNDKLLAKVESAFSVSELRFVRKYENIVYIGKYGDENVYLRFTTPFRRSKDGIRAELHWIEFPYKNSLPVVRVIHSNNGQPSLTLRDDDQQFEVCLMTG